MESRGSSSTMVPGPWPSPMEASLLERVTAKGSVGSAPRARGVRARGKFAGGEKAAFAAPVEHAQVVGVGIRRDDIALAAARKGGGDDGGGETAGGVGLRAGVTARAVAQEHTDAVGV